MENAWPFFQEKLMGIKKCHHSENRSLQKWTLRVPIPWILESFALARLGWWFSILSQVSDSAIPKRKGIHTKIMKWIKTINCILLLGLGMFSFILTVFEIFKRIWHIRKSDILGLWFLFKLFIRSWLRVNLRF